ncbi:hypothetical protein PJ985_16020 [Streptomyces sp. ACA25]|uniref:hypothetical protein n=1 Tax=Streptomyces sp. ACA25 TaxID=3022596 RepID=UPI0023079FC3|nr:hypothetical protein [Streptomyces sp. ACA25]MDB1089068.1 hypothetical protein [Streptomyces sp. ACA25]
MLRSRLRACLLATAGAATLLFGLVPSATASAAPEPTTGTTAVAGTTVSGTGLASAEVQQSSGFWACTVPPGYTYTHTQVQLRVCGSGLRAVYHVVPPSDGLWACTVPAGFTYDTVQSLPSTCRNGEMATSYRLREPVDGLWACTVPHGFTYDAVQNLPSTCRAGQMASSYRLRGV